MNFENEAKIGEKEERFILVKGCASKCPLRDFTLFEGCFNKLTSFSNFVGLPIDGFEEDILEL